MKRKEIASGETEVGDNSKKVKSSESETVTNTVLNDKLDLILKGVEKLNEKRVNAGTNKPVTTDEEIIHILNKIKSYRSMKEILQAGFSYDIESGTVSCLVCSDKSEGGEFSYSAENGLEFDEDECIPPEFASLKVNSMIRGMRN
jgi:deoxyribodipyrimidine photolyase-like uncharacterized protein